MNTDEAPARIHVYHRCLDFACGSIWIHEAVDRTFWWAENHYGEWQIRIHEVPYSGLERLKALIAEAARLPVTAAAAVAITQDARAEAPDV